MTDIDANKVRRLDGGLLLVFRELLRTGRASQAATRLGLSQPAISHALNRLRDLFEDPLFVRRPHGFEPTRRALELGPQVERILELTGQALSRQRGFDPTRSTRHFRFGAPEFVIALIGAGLVERLAAAAPRVTFAVGHASEDEVYQGLRTGEGEFALGRFGAARAGYSVEPLYEDEYCVTVRRGHPKVQGRISQDDWLNLGHIYAWSPSETVPDEAARRGDPRMLAAVPQWLTALMLVAATDGIATCPRRLAERHAARLGLQVLDTPFPPNRITVSVVRAAGVEDAGLDWFIDQVRAAALA